MSTDPDHTIESNEPLQTIESAAEPDQTIESLVDPLQTIESTADPDQTIESPVELVQTIESTNELVQTIDPLHTIDSRFDAVQTIESAAALDQTIEPLHTIDPLQTIEPVRTIDPDWITALVILPFAISMRWLPDSYQAVIPMELTTSPPICVVGGIRRDGPSTNSAAARTLMLPTPTSKRPAARTDELVS